MKKKSDNQPELLRVEKRNPRKFNPRIASLLGAVRRALEVKDK